MRNEAVSGRGTAGRRSGWRRWSAAALAAAMLMPGWAARAQAPEAKPTAAAAAESEDVLVMRDGRTLRGKILKEDDKGVTFRGTVNGLPFETTYAKADILSIRRAAGAGEATAQPAAEKPADGAADATAAEAPSDGKQVVYYMEWKGKFGADVTQTPIRDAINDARRQKADVIVIKVDNDFSVDPFTPIPNDVIGSFDELFRAGPIMPIFLNEIPRTWEKQPRLVFWVKQAMGGIALMPLIAPEIYFTSESRMGGIRGIQEMLQGRGDEVVRQKQYSLRMATAEGWAIAGGYDFRLVRAMADVTYVLSYRYQGGQVELLERMPENPAEFLLTDDGDGAKGHADTENDKVRGLGNDVLTMTAPIAEAIGVSKGTVDTLDDLIFRLGLARNSRVVEDSSKRIFDNWRRQYEAAGREIRENLEQYAGAQVQGDYEERQRVRGQQIRNLETVLRLLKRYAEVFDGRWRAQNGVPPDSQLYVLIEQKRMEQLMDER